MKYSISQTDEGVIKYPQHKHTAYEIMLYTEGEGYLLAAGERYPFSPGTVIIVPPAVEHGSVSRDGFKNISIGGDFSGLVSLDKVTALIDNGDSTAIAKIIYKNRFGNAAYLWVLVEAYVSSIMQKVSTDNAVTLAARKIAETIGERLCDSELALNTLLAESGYAEDYIRAEFRRITGKTPVDFLTDLRIRRAMALIEIYGNSLPLSLIAERCGFSDYPYFSRRFKAFVGTSAREYKKERAYTSRD